MVPLFSKSMQQQMTKELLKNKTYLQLQEECDLAGVSLDMGSFVSWEEPGAAQTLEAFSDQCETMCVILQYEDEDKTRCIEQKTITGSIFRQFTEGIATLSTLLAKPEAPTMEWDGVYEAVVNGFVHGAYTPGNGIKIEISPAGVDVLSNGGLPEGVTLEDFENGVCTYRNPQWMRLFIKCGYAKGIGAGLRVAKKAYKELDCKPVITVSEHSFLIKLPALEKGKEKNTIRIIKDEMTDQYRKVLTYIDEYGAITDEQVMGLLGVRRTRAYTIIQEMLKKQFLVQWGKGKTKRYGIEE